MVIDCAVDDELNDEALLRYSRHILLPEIDIAGQQRWCQSRALVIGAGGLGSPVALYLASAGVGHISIADHDIVELSNLQRQIIHDMDSLQSGKAASAARRIRGLNPNVSVSVLATRLSGQMLDEQVACHDIVLDCSDNFGTRHAVNRACVARRVPLVSGAAARFAGQLLVLDSREAASPCYHCLFPEEGEASDGRCATFGVLSPLLGVIGSLQAVEALKWLAGLPSKRAWLTLYDALSGDFRRIKVTRDPACPVCGGSRVPG